MLQALFAQRKVSSLLQAPPQHFSTASPPPVVDAFCQGEGGGAGTVALPRERDWRRCLTRARTTAHQNPGNGPAHPEQLHPHPAADVSPLRVFRGGLGMLAHGLRCGCSAAFPCLRLSELRSVASDSARCAMRIMMLSWVGGALRLSCLLLRMDARAASERCHVRCAVCSKPV